MEARAQHVLVAAMDPLLLAKGFRRSKRLWLRTTDSTILVVELEKWPWGKQYGVVLGVLVRQLSENPSPRSHVCHISVTLESLSLHVSGEPNWTDRSGNPLVGHAVPAEVRRLSDSIERGSIDLSELSVESLEWMRQHGPRLSRALDFENDTMRDEERARIVKTVMESIGLPFLESFATVPQICKRLKKGALKGVAVWKVVYGLCGIPGPD